MFPLLVLWLMRNIQNGLMMSLLLVFRCCTYLQRVHHVFLARTLAAAHYSQYIDHFPLAHASTAVHFSQWVEHGPLARALTAV